MAREAFDAQPSSWPAPPKTWLICGLRATVACSAQQPAPSQQLPRRAAAATSSATAFRLRACSLSLPSACPEKLAASPSKQTAGKHCQPAYDQKGALKRLRQACGGEAGWECFYATHSLEMAWGGLGNRSQVRKTFAELCQAPCPKPPRRCYKKLACARTRLRR